MKSFSEMKLPAPLEKAVQALGYKTPTALQIQAVPAAMSNRDLFVSSPAQGGKTLAFLIPMMNRVLKSPSKGALILVPTSELGHGVEEVLKKVLLHAPEIKHAVLVNDVPLESQSSSLSVRPRVLIATPDRLVEHLKKGAVSLSSMEILVLNEADRLLEKGFQAQLTEILRFLPRSRQTLLFSEKLSPEVTKMSEKWLREPVRVTIQAVAPVAPKTTAKKAAPESKSSAAQSESEQNDVLLNQLKIKKGSILVFTRTKSRTDILAKHLALYGHPVARMKTIKGFRSGECRILVATDVEARALDTSTIQHVINYDLLKN